MEPPRGAVERDFLRPALLGASVAPFRVLAPLRAVIPWDAVRGGLLDAEMAASRGYPRLSQWLEKTEKLWNENGRGRRSLLEQYDYFSQLSKQFPIAPVRVVYTASGTNLVAAVVQNEAAIIEHKLYWAATASLKEAHYLCSIFNSEALRSAVEPYQGQGQWGARDFDKYVFNLPIPRFDSGNMHHLQLAAAGARAEAVADAVPGVESKYFVTARRHIRSALVDDGVADQLEALATKLLQGE